MLLRPELFLNILEKSMLALELKVNFRNKTAVDIATGKRGKHSNLARVASHEFYESNTINGGLCLDLGALDGALGLLDGGVEAEALIDESDVIIDGLWDADNGAHVLSAFELIGDFYCAAVCAVSAENIYLIEAHSDDGVADAVCIMAAAGTAQYGAAFMVDVLDAGRSERGDFQVGGIEAAVAKRDAGYTADVVQLLEGDNKLPDDGIQARTQAAAGDNTGADLVLRVKGELTPRACAQKLAGHGGILGVGDDVDEDGLMRADKVGAEVALAGVVDERGGEGACGGPVGDVGRAKRLARAREDDLGEAREARGRDLAVGVGVGHVGALDDFRKVLARLYALVRLDADRVHGVCADQGKLHGRDGGVRHGVGAREGRVGLGVGSGWG